MREWIRQWLGITEVQKTIDYIDARISRTIGNHERVVKMAEGDLRTCRVILTDLVRSLVAKGIIDKPKDPFSKETRAESDAIGDEVIAKLIAEDKARRHTLGEI